MTLSFDPTYDQLLKLRFEQISETVNNPHVQLTADLYIDLLSIFHNPDKFEASTFIQYPLEVVLDYLRQTHQLYLNKSFAEIEAGIASLPSETSTFSTVQTLSRSFFASFRNLLTAHIEEEEQDLFPYVDQMIRVARYEGDTSALLHDQNPLGAMARHSDNLENDLRNFIEALEMMSPALQDHFGFRMLMTRLHLFELDLRIHGQLEEEVLMPRALLLRQEVIGQA